MAICLILFHRQRLQINRLRPCIKPPRKQDRRTHQTSRQAHPDAHSAYALVNPNVVGEWNANAPIREDRKAGRDVDMLMTTQ